MKIRKVTMRGRRKGGVPDDDQEKAETQKKIVEMGAEAFSGGLKQNKSSWYHSCAVCAWL